MESPNSWFHATQTIHFLQIRFCFYVTRIFSLSPCYWNQNIIDSFLTLHISNPSPSSFSQLHTHHLKLDSQEASWVWKSRTISGYYHTSASQLVNGNSSLSFYHIPKTWCWPFSFFMIDIFISKFHWLYFKNIIPTHYSTAAPLVPAISLSGTLILLLSYLLP